LRVSKVSDKAAPRTPTLIAPVQLIVTAWVYPMVDDRLL
jgi:hypothetical protein